MTLLTERKEYLRQIPDPDYGPHIISISEQALHEVIALALLEEAEEEQNDREREDQTTSR